MNKYIVVKQFIDDDNIKYVIFINNLNKYCVGMYDLDSGETISIISCTSKEQAEALFRKASRVT